MARGAKSAIEAVRLLRKAVRRTNKTWKVVGPQKDARGGTRGKGNHVMWGVYDSGGNELARGSLTTYSGDMSKTVTSNFEADFEKLLGEGWMDR